MNITTFLGILNMICAGLVSVTAMMALVSKVEGRDPRLLVMPIFAGIAFFFLSFSWLTDQMNIKNPTMEAFAWQVVHFGLLLGLYLFVRSFAEHRHRE